MYKSALKNCFENIAMATLRQSRDHYPSTNPPSQLYPTYDMPTTRQTRARASRERSRSPERAEGLPPVVLRYEKYQDMIKVNSIEEKSTRPRYTGVQHWQHMMSKMGQDLKSSLDHIDYRDAEGPQDGPSDTSEDSDEPSPYASQGPPSSSSSPGSYDLPIYSSTTHSHTVLLTILRIAQRNLPKLNLLSAMNHIPNLLSGDQLPTILPSAPGNLTLPAFLDKSAWIKQFGDLDIHVAFLPYFYDHELRYAIGLYHALNDPLRCRIVSTCFFTPCI